MAPNFGVVLSVVVIAKNEVHNLPRCLNSVHGLADEVVVVDSGSTDGTAELAEAQGARVFQREFTTYADQKNWAASQATQPFVLSLDADEALSEHLRSELLEWKRRQGEALFDNRLVRAWSMPRLTCYCGSWIRHSGWYPDRKIRLWASGSGTWKTASETAVLHEAWVPNPDVQVDPLSGDLLHYSYHTREDHHRQWSKFATIGAEDATRLARSSGRLKPWLRGVFQFAKQFVFQGGWRDGRAGWEVAKWSACSAFWKWRLVRASGFRSGLKRVAIARTDALGDNVLTLPLAGALKTMLPGVEVVWICRPYAEGLIRQSEHVDEVRTWSGSEGVLHGLDAVVFGFPEPDLMKAASKAGVPYRVATGRRLSSLRWANLHVWRGRRAHPEHETLQGLRLLHALSLPARWRFPERTDWQGLHGLKPPGISVNVDDIDWRGAVVLHPGNHGSANGWSVAGFEELASLLTEAGLRIVVSGTEAERPALASWLNRANGNRHVVDAVGCWSLLELMGVLAQVQCVVASSTGPLHIASALGTPVVGLYRSEAPFWPERWAPLGPGQVLSTNKIQPNGGLDLSVDEVFDAVIAECNRRPKSS